MDRLASIYIKKLKGLEDIELVLPACGVVALMGGNGTGKSTLLHELACLFEPFDKKRINSYKWSDYFIPHNKNTWSGSNVIAKFLVQNRGGKLQEHCVMYSKGEGRWRPRYDRRPKRHVSFFPLTEFSPHIELEKYRTSFAYDVKNSENLSHLCEPASKILGKSYKRILRIRRRSKTVREFLEVLVQEGDAERVYTSFYMGAGEQKVLYLLEKIENLPKKSLVLIEEIEAFLHGMALNKLVNHLVDAALKKEHQIVFSTHWANIAKMQDSISIYSIYRGDNGKTYFNRGPDVLVGYELIGDPQSLCQVLVYVEDNLARQIVNDACWAIGLQNLVRVETYGASINCFTVAAGAAIFGRKDVIVVMDGDVNESEEVIRKKIDKVITGHDRVGEKASAIKMICQLRPPNRESPEQFMIDVLKLNFKHSLSAAQDNLRTTVLGHAGTMSPKEAVYQTALEAGESLEEVQSKILGIVNNTIEWHKYVEEVGSEVKKRLKERDLLPASYQS